MPKLLPTKYKVLVSEKTYTPILVFNKNGTIKNKEDIDEDGNVIEKHLYGLFDMRPQTPEEVEKRNKSKIKNPTDYVWKISVIEIGQGIKHYFKDKSGKLCLNYKNVWELQVYTNDCQTWINPDDIVLCVKHRLVRRFYKKGKNTNKEPYLECRKYELQQAASEPANNK